MHWVRHMWSSTYESKSTFCRSIPGVLFDKLVCKPYVSGHPHALKWKHTQHMWHCSFFTRKKKEINSRILAGSSPLVNRSRQLSPWAYKTNQLRDWQATRTTSYKNGKPCKRETSAGYNIRANSPVLSGSLPDTTPTSRSPVRVTISPG